jgi:3-(methylthio)propanoyl-CoA dehydrogenase
MKEKGEIDADFYKGKIATARFYVMNHVPDIFGYLKTMKYGDRSAIDIPEESFM